VSRNARLELIDLRPLQVRAVKWIEKPYLARGELHILQGHGSAGKGSLTCMWAAEATRRREHVVMVIAEDDLSSQIKPRLIAAGADFEYVHVLEVRIGDDEDALLIPDDLHALEELIVTESAQFVTIDPLLTHVPEGADSHKDQHMKRVLTPLSKLAQRTGCTIIGVHHFKKDTSGGARFAGQGSGAFSTTARVVLSMAKTDDGLHVVEVSKSNIGPENIGQSFRVRIVQVPAADDNVAEVPLLERDGEAEQTVDEILAKPKRTSKSDKARERILQLVADGTQIESDELDARVGSETGLAQRTVQDLRKRLRREGLIQSIPVRTGSTIDHWLVTTAEVGA
jgi:RecA-family ATPase